ncbi:MAG TPA: response regulator transcription factor, partial [Bacillota bacterium]|nr:response regulator transcription factor [Bacillota bacterium]
MTQVLVVDDESHIQELVKFNLEKEGYQVETASDGRRAVEKAAQLLPDLILLDVMLPEMSGLEVCRTLHSKDETRKIPIIMLTARSEEIDKILGLEMGADDYITKPFSPRELVARVKAMLRRVKKENEPRKHPENRKAYGDLLLDPERVEAKVRGQKLDLTHKEFELLKVLLSNPGKVFTREALLETIWGYDYYGDTRTVDVHIRHLRQ